jgi:hypothetical protein
MQHGSSYLVAMQRRHTHLFGAAMAALAVAFVNTFPMIVGPALGSGFSSHPSALFFPHLRVPSAPHQLWYGESDEGAYHSMKGK